MGLHKFLAKREFGGELRHNKVQFYCICSIYVDFVSLYIFILINFMDWKKSGII